MNQVLVPCLRLVPLRWRRAGPAVPSSARPPCPGTWPRRSAACSARRAGRDLGQGACLAEPAAAWGSTGTFP